MGALTRSFDWGKTRLGPVHEWPQSLRTSLSICLSSQFPIVLFWGPDLVMLYNDAYRPITGEKHPRCLGQPGLDVWSEVREVVGPMLRGVMTTGKATWSEDLMLPIVRFDVPEESYFTFTYSPIRVESGAVGGVFCAVVETTDKVIEERRLRLLNALAENPPEMSVEDACARAAIHIARFPADVPFALLYLRDESAGAMRLVGAANIEAGSVRSPSTIRLGEHSAWRLEERVQPSNEPAVVPLEPGDWGGARAAVLLPIERSGGGGPFGFVVAGVSPLLRKNDSYDRFHTLLASSVSQSVSNAAAYAEERRRTEALAELDRAKTAFFANVSHEFRTPLTLMLAPLQDLLAAPSNASVDRPTVDLLHRNTLRLLKLVNTLLAFSRIEAGRAEAVYEPVDLSALTVDLASNFRSAIARAGLEFVVDCPPLFEPIYVDRDMWEKIALNLLSNALRYTFEGSIELRLRLDVEGARFEVSDTGTGIAEAELPRLFERFHRIEGARSRSHEGSGIGLALVAELVRLHGGSVCVKSRIGEGTTFTVVVPRGSSHLPELQIRGPRSFPPPAAGAEAYVNEALGWGIPGGIDRPLDPPPPAAGTRPRERIVFADDNADMRDYVSRLLGERWSVEAVADGSEALAAVRRRPPSLVLCDVMMPGLDGFGLIQVMRADAALRGIPIVILSARAGEEEAAKGLTLGANDYIAKPFSARELLVRVASALAAARVAREMQSVAETQRTNLYRHFMQAPFPVAVLKGPRHVVELANPPILVAWGKKPEIVGLPLEEGLPELRGQPFLAWLDGVFRTGVGYEGKDQLAWMPTGPNGALEEVYCDFAYAPLRDVDGAVEGVLMSAFLVTDRVRARKELERALARAESSETQFRDLVDNLPELAWDARPDGHIDFYNRRWYEYTGTTFEQMEGWGWKSVHDPKMLPEVVTRWNESLSTGKQFELEFPLRGAGGEFRWFLTRAIPLKDSGGRIVRWFGTNTDVDDVRRERKRAELLATELTVTTERLHASQRAANIGIFDWDLRTNRVIWSPEIYVLLGLEPNAIEPSAEAWTAALLAEDRQVGWRAFQAATETRQTAMEVEVRLRQPSGIARWVRLSSQIDYAEDGTPVRWLGGVVDIQALKEAAETTARALDAAERTGRAKDEFLATMSHELRTPLNAIVGWASMLESDHSDSGKVKRGLSVIARNAQAQTRLVSDLMDVSRIVSGKLLLSMKRIELASVVHAAAEVIRPAADAKGVRLVLALDAHVGAVIGDADRLQQIVWNLLSNAVRFTPARGRVTIAAERSNSTVRLTVVDTGAGIRPEHLARIFERFQQVDSSTTRAHGGLGLGLAIVRHLVEGHGGTVAATSEGPNLGSTFTVVLPIHAVEPFAPEPGLEGGVESEARAKVARAPAALGDVRTLIVDDEQDSLELLRLFLEEAGATVTAVTSAREALEARGPFDILISDIGMPEMDGYALIRRLRALPASSRVPAIALTAYARSEDAELARSAGYQQHLAKPVNAGELLSVVARLVREQSSHG